MLNSFAPETEANLVMLGDFFPPGWVNFPAPGAIGRAMPLVRYYSSIKDFL